MSVADLLQWAANGRHTGSIQVTRGETTKTVYINEGKIVSCISTDPREVLGHFMVSHGAIDEEALQKFVMVQERDGRLLGEIFVEHGAIDQPRLEEMLRLKAEEAIFDLFTWTDGHFSFHDGVLPDFDLVPISLGVTSLVLEGTRRLDEWQRIREVIPSSHCVPVAVGELATDDVVDPGRRTVLASVDDDRSIEDLCLHTHSTEFFVCETLLGEILRGRIKVVRPRVLSTGVAAHRDASADSMMEIAREHLAAGEFERTVRYLQAAVSIEPNDRELRRQVAEIESDVRAMIEEWGVRSTSVPELAIGLDQLSRLDLDPTAGFILSRVDGVSTVASIVKISPLPEIDALVVIWRLVRGGQLSV
jgi:hypothetical protein